MRDNGHKIADLFCKFGSRLEKDAHQEFDISEGGVLLAKRDLLDVALAETVAEIDAEIDNYASLWTDMRAFCLEYGNPTGDDDMYHRQNNAISQDGALTGDGNGELYVCNKTVAPDYGFEA